MLQKDSESDGYDSDQDSGDDPDPYLAARALDRLDGLHSGERDAALRGGTVLRLRLEPVRLDGA